MGKVYAEIDAGVADFIVRQKMFFVATAPTAPDGLVNVSPKGLDTFRVLGPKTVAYLDLVGSGIETVAHVRENGRLTIMFCAFEGRPLILRLYGRGRVIEPDATDWPEWLARFPEVPGARTIVVLDVERIIDACGFAVPLYEFRGGRSQLTDFAVSKGEDGLAAYKAKKNARSLDGLPGLRTPEGGGA